MTSVRISVTSGEGDIEITETLNRGSFGEGEQARISRLLEMALGKIDRAYGLSQKPCVEAPKSVGGAE